MNSLIKVISVFVTVINICHGFTFTSNVPTRKTIVMSNNDNYDLFPQEASGRNSIFKSLMSALVVVPTLTAAGTIGVLVYIYAFTYIYICIYINVDT
jgi:hypothetical protein